MRRIAWVLAAVSLAANLAVLGIQLPSDGVPAGYRHWQELSPTAWAWTQEQWARLQTHLPGR